VKLHLLPLHISPHTWPNLNIHKLSCRKCKGGLLVIHLLNPGVLQLHKQQKCFLLPSTSKIKICSTLCIPFYVYATMLTNAQHIHTNTRCMNTHTCTVRGECLLEWWVFRFYGTTYKYTQSTYTCVHIIMYTHMHTAIHLLTYTETHTLLLHYKFMD